MSRNEFKNTFPWEFSAILYEEELCCVVVYPRDSPDSIMLANRENSDGMGRAFPFTCALWCCFTRMVDDDDDDADDPAELLILICMRCCCCCFCIASIKIKKRNTTERPREENPAEMEN